ncbi:MAG: purine/pyrimidine permease [Mailhella sp.]|nr:purine/pyrimidine permease [Mailhella sp.]
MVTAIGFSLLAVGANSFAGGFGAPDFGSVQNWTLGSFTLICCISFNIFAKGNLKPLAVLFGLVMGYILALFMGKVDLSLVKSAGLVSLPHFLPFEPEFNLSAIISVTMIFLVSATETIGDTSAMTATVLKRDATDREISGSIACDGFVSSLSALFGCLPITSFSQNIGLLAMTKVINRYTIATGAAVMILAGIFPIIGAILASLPEAVLGGCTIMMFGNIVISGLMMIGNCGYSQRNIVIAALSLSVGLGFTQAPQMFAIFPDIVRSVFAENCVAVVFIAAVIMNLIMPKEGEVKTRMPLK